MTQSLLISWASDCLIVHDDVYVPLTLASTFLLLDHCICYFSLQIPTGLVLKVYSEKPPQPPLPTLPGFLHHCILIYLLRKKF